MLDLKGARQAAGEIGWLGLTPPAFRDSVLERTALRAMKAGETLHYVGDDAIGMYGVVAGRLRVNISAEDHGPYLVYLMRPGAWFGEGPSVTGGPRILTPSAAVDTQLLFVPLGGLHEIVLRNPAYWRFFFIPLLEHTEIALGALSDLMLRDHTKRLVASLLRLAGSRTGQPKPRGKIEIEASQEEIAIMANVARTTANSVLRKLAKDGLIEVGYGQVTLLSASRLRAMIAD